MLAAVFATIAADLTAPMPTGLGAETSSSKSSDRVHEITGAVWAASVAALDHDASTSAMAPVQLNVSNIGMAAVFQALAERDAAAASGDLERHRHARDSSWATSLSSALAMLNGARQVDFWDSRFDSYTLAIAAVNAGNVIGYRQHWGDAGRPTAAAVTVPTSKQDIEDVACGLASDVRVPKTDENFGDVGRLELTLNGAITQLSFPETAADCGVWGADESAEQTVKQQLFAAWPADRVLVPWSGSKMSDSALEDLVFKGYGQHRVVKIEHAADPVATSADHYAVYTNFAAGLEVRPGFAALGADAYFDRDGKVTKIARGGVVYTPGGEQGHPASTRCQNEWVWNWFKSGWVETCETTPAVLGWRHAKMAFRGTLNLVITAIDHLYGIHLTVANAIVTANVEELSPDHPVRRLMTPFGFRTEAINYQASFALVNDRGLLHRGTPLSKQGLVDLFKYAQTESAGITWATIPARKAAKGVDTLLLPLDEDGGDFYAILKTFVHKYLAHYYSYAGNECGADAELVAWRSRVNAISPSHDLPPELSCEVLEDILATFMYLVSAGHNLVGSIAGEQEDPCFAPSAWVEGDLCGLPRTGYTQSLIISLTSLEQPKIWEDYSHLMLDPAAEQLWHGFSAELRAFDLVVADRNQHRSREFAVFDVDKIETAVGI